MDIFRRELTVKPIRVLHIVTYMGRGGLETMLMNYYRHMDRNEVQFDFLVHRDFEADYDREILSMGGRIYHISRLVPWSSNYCKELKSFFKAHPEYKIVHVHQDCLSSVALQCAKECNVPVRIAHSHSSSAVKNLKYPIKLHYMKKIPKFATNLFACGEQAGNWMFSGQQFEIIRNAIDVSKYQHSLAKAREIRKNFDIENNLVIGHVGNFTPAKNHDFLLEIFYEIYQIEPKAKLLLVGGGEGMKKIKDKAMSKGVENQVIFTGTRSDVNDLFQAMDVFVFPSLYEGLPVTLIEAQASGIHCVISDRVPSECIITNRLVSYKKLEDSPEEWAKHILKESKLSRENQEQEITDAGYNIKIAAQKLEKFYLNQIKG